LLDRNIKLLKKWKDQYEVCKKSIADLAHVNIDYDEILDEASEDWAKNINANDYLNEWEERYSKVKDISQKGPPKDQLKSWKKVEIFYAIHRKLMPHFPRYYDAIPKDLAENEIKANRNITHLQIEIAKAEEEEINKLEEKNKKASEEYYMQFKGSTLQVIQSHFGLRPYAANKQQFVIPYIGLGYYSPSQKKNLDLVFNFKLNKFNLYIVEGFYFTDPGQNNP